MAANPTRKKAEQGRSTKTVAKRGEQAPAPSAVPVGATTGGQPAAAVGASAPEVTSQDRLEQQREEAARREEEAEERVQQAAARRPEGELEPSGVYTAVVKNGLARRRCGVIFGAEPVTVDITDWSLEEKERFLNDDMLMIMPGAVKGARGAALAPARGIPAAFTGGGGENATPGMLKSMAQGKAQAHPSRVAANPVTGGSFNPAVRELENQLNNKE